MLANQLHFAVSTEPLAENFPWEVMLECPMVMLIPAGHPACRRTSVSLADFRNDPFVINTMGLDEEKTLRLCAEAGFEPTIVLRTNEAYTAGNLLNRMQAVSICSADSICSRLPMYGLIDSEGPAGGMGMYERNTVLLEGLDHTHRIGLTRRGKRMNEACEEFYRTVQRYLEAKNRQVQRFVTHYYHD